MKIEQLESKLKQVEKELKEAEWEEGFERALIGMKEGEEKTVRIESQDAYGEKKEYLVPRNIQDATGKVIKTESILVPEKDINAAIYMQWLGSNNMDNLMPNNLALQDFVNGSYDLTVPPDEHLPTEIISNTTSKPLFTGQNSIPLSFFAAALRYAAKPGDNEFKKTGIKKFKDDFGIDILTREKMIKGAK